MTDSLRQIIQIRLLEASPIDGFLDRRNTTFESVPHCWILDLQNTTFGSVPHCRILDRQNTTFGSVPHCRISDLQNTTFGSVPQCRILISKENKYDFPKQPRFMGSGNKTFQIRLLEATPIVVFQFSSGLSNEFKDVDVPFQQAPLGTSSSRLQRKNIC